MRGGADERRHAVPVIVAKFRDHAYVWLDLEERSELSHLWREQGAVPPYVPTHAPPFPELVRGHGIDAETGDVYDGSFLGRGGTWHSGEGLWVRSDVAERAVVALAKFRHDHTLSADRIAAPNWRCLTAIRALALAHGLPDPGINSEPARSGTVTP